jgi:hypothetical protein
MTIGNDFGDPHNPYYVTERCLKTKTTNLLCDLPLIMHIVGHSVFLLQTLFNIPFVVNVSH